MGLSRNKVAVSEGAAGSPPFYGDREADHTRCDRDFVVKLGQKTLVDVYEYCTDRFCCSIVRIQFEILKIQPIENGGVAQLGEHLPCKQGVKGSNPFISTNFRFTVQAP